MCAVFLIICFYPISGADWQKFLCLPSFNCCYRLLWLVLIFQYLACINHSNILKITAFLKMNLKCGIKYVELFDSNYVCIKTSMASSKRKAIYAPNKILNWLMKGLKKALMSLKVRKKFLTVIVVIKVIGTIDSVALNELFDKSSSLVGKFTFWLWCWKYKNSWIFVGKTKKLLTSNKV